MIPLVPLDPVAKALLQRLASLHLPPLESMSAQKVRETENEWFGAAIGKSEPVERIENDTIPGQAGEIPIRLYFPKEYERPLPIFVYFHGGGWVFGNPRLTDPLCCSVANRARCIGVSVGYRLAPENKFPAAVEDAYSVIDWVSKNPDSLGGDSARISVGGDSAGGNLAAVSCLMAKDRGGPKLNSQVLIYPSVGHLNETASLEQFGEGYLLTRDDMIWFAKQYLNSIEDVANPYFSPIRSKDLSGLPPALLITGEFDPMRDDGEEYAKKLLESGAKVKLHRYDGMIHGFLSLAGILKQGKEAIFEIGDYLRDSFTL